jgi:hypothetical protein
MRRDPGIGWIVLVLAIGLAGALLIVTIGIFTHTKLSENETQVLTGWGGGIVGIVGAYIGYRVANGRRHDRDDE